MKIFLIMGFFLYSGLSLAERIECELKKTNSEHIVFPTSALSIGPFEIVGIEQFEKPSISDWTYIVRDAKGRFVELKKKQKEELILQVEDSEYLKGIMDNVKTYCPEGGPLLYRKIGG
ncbi:MAG: hypothetical protein KBD63_07445 [Bacteriovoracaceae bacterium]|nr:hypothetical protein [Bacteriovoracaceae bacterium]